MLTKAQMVFYHLSVSASTEKYPATSSFFFSIHNVIIFPLLQNFSPQSFLFPALHRLRQKWVFQKVQIPPKNTSIFLTFSLYFYFPSFYITLYSIKIYKELSTLSTHFSTAVFPWYSTPNFCFFQSVSSPQSQFSPVWYLTILFT